MMGGTSFQAASCRCNGPAVPRAAALPTTRLHVACALTSPQPARRLSWKATVFGKHQRLRPQPALSQRRGGARQPLGAAATDGRGIVLVTREAGKNGKLKNKIEEAGLGCLEIPLIETAPGPDRDHLSVVLMGPETFEWICITSPESASVFLESWTAAGRPHVRVAAVGKATGEVLEAGGISVGFVPSKATAVTLVAEIPGPPVNGGTVLYPASLKAQTTLQDGLEGRGYSVKRLDTYNTVPVVSVDSEVLSKAMAADVITIGSPSALKAWIKLVGEDVARDIPVACIGGTSAKAAKKLGLSQIFWPSSPGLDGWMESVNEALESLGSGARQSCQGS